MGINLRALKAPIVELPEGGLSQCDHGMMFRLAG